MNTISLAMTGILGINIAIIIGILGLFTHFINKIFDDFKGAIQSELKSIDEKLNNYITDTDKKIESLSNEIKEIRKEVNDKLDRLLAQS